jgi:transcriptional regulator with XRE-family HTH domain
MDSSRFGARLRELREAAGLSQKALAERAGLSQGAIAHWEQGLREPSWSNVVALAEALGVDCRSFLEPPGKAAKAKRPRGRPRKGT